jgi:peptidyl-tRNA hydrolase, PTH1 family
MKFLIAGLGNIGKEYELTRHNIGFLVLDQIADEKGITFKVDRLAEKAEFKFKGRQIHLIKPTTYMNLSGKAINYWLQTLKIPKENLLVIVDDIALPFGKLRLRAKGSGAGHNGLKNIEEITGGTNYARLKFGLGDDYRQGRQIDFVLSNFTKQEMEQLPPMIDKAKEYVYSFSTQGVSRTMNILNEN